MLLENITETTNYLKDFIGNDTSRSILNTIIYIATAIIIAIISARLTRQTTKDKLTIKFYKKSIKKLYLKLYCYVFYLTDFSSYTLEQTESYFNTINQLIQANPIYCSSTLNSLMFQLHDKMKHQKNCSMIMLSIKQCIIDEYNRLKRRLNYPTSAFWDYFNYSLSPLKKIGISTLISLSASYLFFSIFGIICSHYESPSILQRLSFIIFGTLTTLCLGAFIGFFITFIILSIMIGISSFITYCKKRSVQRKREKSQQEDELLKQAIEEKVRMADANCTNPNGNILTKAHKNGKRS